MTSKNKITRRTFLQGTLVTTGAVISGFAFPSTFLGVIQKVEIPDSPSIHEFDAFAKEAGITKLKWEFSAAEMRVQLSFHCYRPVGDVFRKDKAFVLVHTFHEMMDEFAEFSPAGLLKTPWLPPDHVMNMAKDEAMDFLQTENVLFVKSFE